MSPAFSRAVRPLARIVVVAGMTGVVGCGSYLHDHDRDPALDPLVARTVSEGSERARSSDEPTRVDGEQSPATGSGGAASTETETVADDTVALGASSSFRGLGDTQLDALVAEAVSHHRDMLTGIATVERSRALAMAARAARLPTANLVLTGQIGRSIIPGIGAVDARSLALTVPISYEVDLFGRYAIEHHAAEEQAEAAEEDLAALSISVAAEVADVWFDLTLIEVRRRSLESQRELQTRVLAMVDARARQGLAAPIDALSQRQLLATTEAQLALLDSEGRVQSNRLAVILGRSSTNVSFTVPDTLPELPQLPDAGLGAERLASRPDVRAALLRLEAADHLVTAAVRAQLPILRIGVTPGYTTLLSERGGVEASAQGFTWQVNGTLTVPIFDGLRAHATVLDRRAQVDEQLRRYEQRLLQAGSEVESAIVLDRQARVQLEQLSHIRDLSRQMREAVEASYRQGLTDYVRVLIAMRDELSAEASWLDARRALLTYRLQLYRALGGDLGLGE